jgi:hypothetical protein
LVVVLIATTGNAIMKTKTFYAQWHALVLCEPPSILSLIILSRDPYIDSKSTKSIFHVVKKIIFEALVMDLIVSRLQEVGDR